MRRVVCLIAVTFLASGILLGQSDEENDWLSRLLQFKGTLSANKYGSDSTGNSHGRYGSRYSADSINNPYSEIGRAAQNKYGSGGPAIIGEDGRYLGRLNRNKYDPESVSNPFGRYGSKYSADSIKNPFGRYGSRYSSNGATNPFTTKASRLYMPKRGTTVRQDLRLWKRKKP